MVNFEMKFNYTHILTLYAGVYMLGAKHGFAQSMDRVYLRAQSTNSQTIHGLRCVSKQLIAWFFYKFTDNPWIALREQTTDRLVFLQIHGQSMDCAA